MLFSKHPRTLYGNAPVHEVICQLRFPTILSINNTEPADFQEAIRDAFPRYVKRQEAAPPQLVGAGGPNPQLRQAPPVSNYNFLSADNLWKLNLTQNFIALSTLRYTGWEDFAHQLDKPLAEFISIYKPAFFERVGLRYLNAISRRDLDLEGTPWKELLKPSYLGLLCEEDVPEQAFTRCTQDMEAAIPGGCRMKLHVGPGMLKRGNDASDKETKLIFDLDVSMSGNVPVNMAAASMQTLHTQAGSIFRDAITDTLHNAMEPE